MKTKKSSFLTIAIFVLVVLLLVVFSIAYYFQEGYYNAKTFYSDKITAQEADNLDSCKPVFQCVQKCKYIKGNQYNLKNSKNNCLMKCYKMQENKDYKCIENINAKTVNENTTSTDNPCQPIYNCVSQCKNSVQSHSSHFVNDYRNSGVNCVDNCINNQFYLLNKKYRCL